MIKQPVEIIYSLKTRPLPAVYGMSGYTPPAENQHIRPSLKCVPWLSDGQHIRKISANEQVQGLRWREISPAAHATKGPFFSSHCVGKSLETSSENTPLRQR